jgi:hypothetical protein
MSGKNGGRITTARGEIDEKGTHGKPAEGCDHSRTNGDVVEGVAMFSRAGHVPVHPPPWFPRDFGLRSPGIWLFPEDEAVRKVARGARLEDVWTNPVFQSILEGGLAWALREGDADVTPNLAAAAPDHADIPPRV